MVSRVNPPIVLSGYICPVCGMTLTPFQTWTEGYKGGFGQGELAVIRWSCFRHKYKVTQDMSKEGTEGIVAEFVATEEDLYR